MQKHHKYFLFFAIAAACVLSDQVTKLWSEARLANPRPPVGPPHTFDVEVPESANGQALGAFLAEELSGTAPKEIEAIVRSWTLINSQNALNSEVTLQTGQTITIRSRKVEVLGDFFHFRYTRNPGAAFGFLSKQDSPYRRPFFIIVSILAIGVIMFIFRKVTMAQKLLIISLSLIVGGAIGNFIDRLAYGWVIDFIDWHYYREFTWPTFNLADAYISVGVALMAIEILIGKDPEEQGDEEIDSPAEKA